MAIMPVDRGFGGDSGAREERVPRERNRGFRSLGVGPVAEIRTYAPTATHYRGGTTCQISNMFG